MNDNTATAPSPLALPESWNAVAEGYASDTVPFFERFALDAIELAGLTPGARVIDVACGPGTLSLKAAERAASVAALDFAEEMVAMLRRRIDEHGTRNVEVLHGDGQALPFGNNEFDAGFSMFGLMFFPDRAAGFRELYRVLRPGARAVVSSWPPLNQLPLLNVMIDAISRSIDPPPPAANFPLSDPEAFRDEMLEAGFTRVEIHTRTHSRAIPNVTAFWEANVRSSAPVALLRRRLGEPEFATVSEKVLGHLVNRFGDASLDAEWTAQIAVGVKGA